MADAALHASAPHRLELLFLGLCGVAAMAAAAFGLWVLVGLAVTAAVAAFIAGRWPELLLGLWLALEPWASYLLRYPTERSLITFDRVCLAILVCGFLAAARRRATLNWRPTAFEVFWAAFVAVAALSVLLQSQLTAFAGRVMVDAFAMPLSLYYAIRRGLDPSRAGAVVAGLGALGLSLPWLGIAELITRTNMLAYEGASVFRAGVVRANGPYINDCPYAMVSAMTAVILMLVSPRRSLFRWGGIAAALASVIPMFRTVAIAVAAALALPALARGEIRRLACAALLLLVGAAAVLPAILALRGSRTFQERISDPASAYSRLATYRAALDIIADAPITGIGLANYKAYFEAKYGTAWYVQVDAVGDEGAESTPHSNYLGTWAELGLLGFSLYLLAWMALVVDAVSRREHLTLAVLAVYMFGGLTLHSGVYPEVNLFAFAALAFAPGLSGTAPARWPAARFPSPAP